MAITGGGEGQAGAKGWVQLSQSLREQEETARRLAIEAYTTLGGSGADEFKMHDQRAEFCARWREHLETLAQRFADGQEPSEPAPRATEVRAPSAARERSETILEAFIGELHLVRPPGKKVYQEAFMSVWRQSGEDYVEAQRLWGAEIYPGDQPKSGRIYVPGADITVVGTAWRAMRAHLDKAQAHGSFEQIRIVVKVENADGSQRTYEWGQARGGDSCE